MTGQHPRAIGQKLKRAGRFRNRLAGFQFHDSLFRCNDAAAKHRNVDTGGWTTLSRTEEGERERGDITAKYIPVLLRFAVPLILPEDSRGGINKFVEDKRVSSV